MKYASTSRIDRITEDEFDALRFGSVRLDKSGIILSYRTDHGISRRRPNEMVGKNFFAEVAPCINAPDFLGRFREGVESNVLYVTFPFRFVFHSRYVDVELTMLSCGDGETAWVFMKDKPSH